MTSDPAAPADGGWSDALEILEARLNATTAAMQNGNTVAGGEIVPAGPFVPPDVTGELPAVLAERAQSILERTDAMRRDLEAEAARIQAELRRIPHRPAETRVGRKLDIQG